MDNEYLYSTHFELEYPVSDLYSARKYLTEDDMTKYLKDTKYIPQAIRDSVLSIKWNLKNEDNGNIEVVTSRNLNKDELKYISEWIRGQNSDGLGEGFEQQDFASCFDEDAYEDELEYNEEACEDDFYYMSSFDWKRNDYTLELIS